MDTNQTKVMRVNLAALTRLDWSRLVRVPAEFNDDQLSRVVDGFYDYVDGGDYLPDNEYWERGHCWVEEVSDVEHEPVEYAVDHDLSIHRCAASDAGGVPSAPNIAQPMAGFEDSTAHFREILAKHPTTMTEVRIEYDGYGDSGAVEDAAFFNGQERVEVSKELVEAAIGLAEELLDANYPGYEIDNGALGTIVLAIPSLAGRIEHQWRVETIDDDSTDFQLPAMKEN